MMSIAGREEITGDTCASLYGRGGIEELEMVCKIAGASKAYRKGKRRR